MPMNEVPTFTSLPPEQRQERFKGLTDIVLGMRVYNFSMGFGGEGIDNLPELLDQTISATLEALYKQLNENEHLAAIYTSLYLKLAAFDVSTETVPNVVSVEAEKMGITRSLLKAATINARQHAMYLRRLLADIKEVESEHASDKKKLLEILGETLTSLRSNVDPPKHSVQLSIDVANVWWQFRDNLVFISMLSNLLNSLQPFGVKRHARLAESQLRKLINESEIVWDCQRPNVIGRVEPTKETESQWIFPKPTSNLKISLNGFCAWSVVRYQGLPIPAKKCLGVLKFKENHFAFSTVDAATEYEKWSEKFTYEISEIARRNPELIELFDLHAMFDNGKAYFPDVKALATKKRVVSREIQTVVHPIPSHIDTAYTWNEWELRRRALHLVYIRKCVTHSVQTYLSNWRRDNVTQVYLPKLDGTQTKRDNYSQVPKPSTFLYGLRGGVAVDQAEGAKEAIAGSPYSHWCKVYRLVDATKVDLTLPIEDHFCGSLDGQEIPMR
uniref:Cilia- and flagella-associated protein 206 n=2 Tax=Mesocestoides corti TaxID=53468 RepID=A0A5K3FD10_MESCO